MMVGACISTCALKGAAAAECMQRQRHRPSHCQVLTSCHCFETIPVSS